MILDLVSYSAGGSETILISVFFLLLLTSEIIFSLIFLSVKLECNSVSKYFSTDCLRKFKNLFIDLCEYSESLTN